MTHVHKLVVKFLNECHILIICIVVAKRVAHKVQLHLDWSVYMNMYINTVYTCCIRSVACNWMSCATCIMQLHKFAVACVACNWILVAKDSCKAQNF
jgi:hypothetical protein